MRIHLIRDIDTEQGVFGRLIVPDFTCLTVERPWLDNAPNVSCIPAGVYGMNLGMYNKGGYPAYELEGVPKRTLIKIHRANVSSDVQGCIGVGISHGVVGGHWAVLSSRVTLDTVMETLAPFESLEIEISWKGDTI